MRRAPAVVAADAGVTFPHAFDMQGDLSAESGYRGAPCTFCLAAAGTLAYTSTGAVSDRLGVTL